MNSDELAQIGQELCGERWQRPLARLLDTLEIAKLADDPDGRRMRRWAKGETPIPDHVAKALFDYRDHRRSLVGKATLVSPTTLYEMMAKIREAHPRASVLYAMVILALYQTHPRPIQTADLCEALTGDRNSAAAFQACRILESLDLIIMESSGEGGSNRALQARLANPLAVTP